VILSDVTCLGCGCACDDISITVRDGRIVEAARACDLGVAWFGDGSLPAEAAIDAVRAPMDAAIARQQTSCARRAVRWCTSRRA
jgi:formylmethanofuran dehydrogenase subunit B